MTQILTAGLREALRAAAELDQEVKQRGSSEVRTAAIDSVIARAHKLHPKSFYSDVFDAKGRWVGKQ